MTVGKRARRSGWSLAVSALAAAGFGVASCSGSPTNSHDCGGGPAPSLVGSYTLTAYTFGSRVYAVPPAAGSLTFTATTYAQTLVLPAAVVGDTSTSDNGTYDIVGASCISWQSLTGKRNFSGSLTLTVDPNVTTLLLNGSDSLHVIVSDWVKNP